MSTKVLRGPLIAETGGRIIGEGSLEAGAAEILYRHQWESAEQDPEGITSRVRDLASGEVYEVRSRYLIACDGAGSRIRKSLGIEMIGPQRIQSFVMVHFSANLRELVKERPGVLSLIPHPPV